MVMRSRDLSVDVEVPSPLMLLYHIRHVLGCLWVMLFQKDMCVCDVANGLVVRLRLVRLGAGGAVKLGWKMECVGVGRGGDNEDTGVVGECHGVDFELSVVGE